MLSLSRLIGEAIQIGEDVVVRVVAVKGNQVQFAIDAPRDVAVWRSEVLERIQGDDDGSGKTPA